MVKRILKALFFSTRLLGLGLFFTLVLNIIFEFIPIVGFLLLFGLVFYLGYECVKDEEKKGE